eukprot:604417-Pleurochrysis_carterae.AAC.1
MVLDLKVTVRRGNIRIPQQGIEPPPVVWKEFTKSDASGKHRRPPRSGLCSCHERGRPAEQSEREGEASARRHRHRHHTRYVS